MKVMMLMSMMIDSESCRSPVPWQCQWPSFHGVTILVFFTCIKVNVTYGKIYLDNSKTTSKNDNYF